MIPDSAALQDPAALQAIGWPLAGDGQPADERWREALARRPGSRPARIVEQHRSGYILADGPGNSFPAESLPEWQRPASYRKGATAPEERPAVGDWVLVEGEGRKARIVELLPRRTAIKRAAAGEHYKQQLIAANIDTVFVVSGLDADFNPRRIERYLLLVRGGAGAAQASPQPVIVLTKADVAAGHEAGAVDDALAALVELAADDVPVRAVNARDRDSVAVLHEWLQPGSTAVLVGSSGAGKSTLTNTLLGIERMKTSEVREHDSRGRHTTTYRSLIPLPMGGCLIDTPGMRELKPTGEEDVAENFADIEALAEQCRFRDCAHQREPGCAVREAIEAGRLDPQRFANFLKLRDEVAAAAGKAATRRAQKQEEKVQVKALNKRLDEKHGRH